MAVKAQADAQAETRRVSGKGKKLPRCRTGEASE